MISTYVLSATIFLYWQDNLTVFPDCDSRELTSSMYELTYNSDSGTPITTCVVDGTQCSSGVCHHELRNNTADSRCHPPVSQFSGEDMTVSVTARSVVGRSISSVSRSISESFFTYKLEVDMTF